MNNMDVVKKNRATIISRIETLNSKRNLAIGVEKIWSLAKAHEGSVPPHMLMNILNRIVWEKK